MISLLSPENKSKWWISEIQQEKDATNNKTHFGWLASRICDHGFNQIGCLSSECEFGNKTIWTWLLTQILKRTYTPTYLV